jgi:formamidopyrimidine-DNA glycosylase
MFELPECLTLAAQMGATLRDKVVARGLLGNTPHKFVWYNRTHREFERLARGKRVGKAWARGRWMFIPLEPGYVLVIGECGGRILYHPPQSAPPRTYHLLLRFRDGSLFTVTTQMWGAMKLHEKGREYEGDLVRNMRPTPIEDRFTLDYFLKLVDGLEDKRTAKGLLTQDQLIPGLGNAIAQDILFKARLHPRQPVRDLSTAQRRKLHKVIVGLTGTIARKGGRRDETDLFGRPGGYKRIMDKDAAGRPCPRCGAVVEKIQYLGGACYFCPRCQALRGPR